MLTRRGFLQTTGSASLAAVATFRNDGLARLEAASRPVTGVAPDDLAADEDYWREIQQAFTLDRTIINLNNGGVCPSPRVVHEALKRYLDISNQSPVYHMWQILEPNIEAVRRRLANAFEIYAHWRGRFAPGTTHNTEHVFSLAVPARSQVKLAPAEHRAQRWLPWREAAAACFSWSNRDAIRMLTARVPRP